MSKRKRVQPVNQFTCCDKAMGLTEFKKHLLEVHEIDQEKMKGRKSLLMHIDYDDSYDYNWQWELENGLKFTQYTRQARTKDTMMF